MDINYVQFAFRDLQSDPFWFSSRPHVCGVYWKLITWIYCEGGRIRYDLAEIEKFLLWDDQKYGSFSDFFSFELKKKFQIRGRFLYHKRCSAELEKSEAAHNKRVSAGRSKSNAPAMLQQCSSNAGDMLDKGKEKKGKEKKGKEKAMPPEMFREFAIAYKTIKAIYGLKDLDDMVMLQKAIEKKFKASEPPYEAIRESLIKTAKVNEFTIFCQGI